MGVYPDLVRPLLFRVDPERAHDAAVRTAELASGSRLLVRAVAARRPDPDPRVGVTGAGLRMRSPVGLAAGFDKSARAVPLLSVLGFGHVEIGPVSADPSAGNPRPRLARPPAAGARRAARAGGRAGPLRRAERRAGGLGGGVRGAPPAVPGRHQRREHE